MLSAKRERPVVLVTGVSSGIGLALARKLWLDDSCRVAVTARRQSLEKIAGEPFRDTERFLVRPLDVTDAAERDAIVAELEARWGGVDVLINNAGIAYSAVFEHMTDDDLMKQFTTNFLGPMALMRLVLPGMRARSSGHIINVSSVSGMMAMPTMSSYTASKFALEGATEAVWYEMRPWGVHATLVQPGFIHSESFSHTALSPAARASRDDPNDPFHAYYHHMAPFIAKIMSHALATPESVADVILRVMRKSRPPLRVSATIDARFFLLLRRWLPRSLYHELLYRSLPGIRHWRPPS